MTENFNIDMREREYQRRFAMLLATAWRDQSFMKKLVAEPEKCFAEFGIAVGKGQRVVVHVDTPEEIHVVIPERPAPFDEALQLEASDNCWKSSKCWNLCD